MYKISGVICISFGILIHTIALCGARLDTSIRQSANAVAEGGDKVGELLAFKKDYTMYSPIELDTQYFTAVLLFLGIALLAIGLISDVWSLIRKIRNAKPKSTD